MATLKYKISVFKQIRYFILYERYIYNITSSLTLWFIYANLEPAHIELFTLPSWVCIPCSLLALFLLVRSEIELGEKILMPYKVRDILNEKYLSINPYESKGLTGIKTDGIYAYVRHPLQAGLLGMMIFMSGVYTTDKVLHLAVMITGIVVGVLMEEERMLVIYKDYK
jgi:protein-S-isoprenylcysteine O-methyltransferase Ste14